MLKYKQGSRFSLLVVVLMMTNTCIKFKQHPNESADNSTVAHKFNIVLSHKYVKIYVSFTVLVSTGWYDDD